MTGAHRGGGGRMDGVLAQLNDTFGDKTPIVVAVFVGVFSLAILGCCLGLFGGSGGKKDKTGGDETKSEGINGREENRGDKAKKPKGKGAGKAKQTSKKVTLPSHPLLAGEFKGHTSAVLSIDMESNGKYLASCSEDRTLRLWHMKTLKEKDHKYSRKNVNLDHATHIKFSPDGTAVVTALAVANTVNVYRISKQKGAGGVAFSDEPVVDFPLGSLDTIISLGIASTGKYIMTCTEKAFSVWTVKGELLTSVQTHQAPNTCAVVSPCGRFVACAGFTPDVKIWEVEFKGDNFNQVARAMELKGHRASVLSFSFSGDSHRVATVSKDGSWKFWDTDVRYQLSEDPKLLKSTEVPEVNKASSARISLSPDARVVAVSVDKEETSSIYVYPTASDAERISMIDIHREVTHLCWDPTSLYLVSAANDRHIRVWHNVLGQKELIRELQGKLPKASSEPLKRRMQQQISDAEKYLKSVGQF